MFTALDSADKFLNKQQIFGLRLIKRRLLATLRVKKSNNWVKEIRTVVKNINNTRSSKHDFKPEEIANPESDAKTRKAMIEKGKYHVEQLDEVRQRVINYEKSKRKYRIYPFDIIQINEHVHTVNPENIAKVRKHICKK